MTGDTEIFLKTRYKRIEVRDWARWLAQERCNSHNIRDLITYFNEMREVAFDLLAEWPFKQIVLDTTKHDLRSCAKEILKHLGFDESFCTEHLQSARQDTGEQDELMSV